MHVYLLMIIQIGQWLKKHAIYNFISYENHFYHFQNDLCFTGHCGKNLRVSVFDQQLLAVTMKNTFIDMLNKCCSKCASCQVVNEIEDTMYPSDKVLNTSDVIFPALGEHGTKKLHGERRKHYKKMKMNPGFPSHIHFHLYYIALIFQVSTFCQCLTSQVHTTSR